MHIKRFSLIVVFAVIFFAVFGSSAAPAARAAGGGWEAWLYDASVGRVVRLVYDGSSALPVIDTLLPDADGGHVAPSRDGRYIAYTVDNVLRVYDSLAGGVVATTVVPFGAVTGLTLRGSPYMWNAAGTRVAVGYAYGLDSGSPGWGIQILDVPSNALVALLQDGSPEAAAVTTGSYSVPVIQRFEDPYITFITVPYATEGTPQYPAYTWNIMGPTVTPNPSLTGFELDQNALGEALMLLHDASYPQAFAPESGFAVPNMVGAYNPLTGALGNYLFAPGAYRVTLAQASELAAVSVADPSTGTPTAIRLFTRGGAPLGEVTEPALIVRYVTSLEGTVGGFIAAASPTSGPGGTTVYRVSTRPGSPDYLVPVSVWNSTLGANYRIVWVSDESATPVTSVEAWAVLTSFSPPPTATPLPVAVPTVTPAAPAPPAPPAPPAAPSGLYVGGQARVQTTAGDRLNVRTGPGRSFSVAVQARNGEIVTIVGGPTTANGYVWWQIRLSEGTVGWAVESADGVQTLVPIG